MAAAAAAPVATPVAVADFTPALAAALCHLVFAATVVEAVEAAAAAAKDVVAVADFPEQRAVAVVVAVVADDAIAATGEEVRPLPRLVAAAVAEARGSVEAPPRPPTRELTLVVFLKFLSVVAIKPPVLSGLRPRPLLLTLHLS